MAREDRELTVALLIRKDLNMSKGKILAQCGHALLGLRVKSPPARILSFKCRNLDELQELERAALRAHVPHFAHRDAGLTQVAPDTLTVVALGPAPAPRLEKLTAHLKLY